MTNNEASQFSLKKVLILDLDWTVRKPKSGGIFNKDPKDFELMPNVFEKLKEFRDDYIIFGLTNQGGVAHGFKTVSDVFKELEFLCGPLLVGVPIFQGIIFAPCDHKGTVYPYNVRSFLRKPNIGALGVIEHLLAQKRIIVDWDNSMMVGDSMDDRQFADIAQIGFAWAADFFNFPRPVLDTF